MSNSIEQYRGGAVSRGVSRQTGRALARIGNDADVRVAAVEARADIDAAKVNATVAVTQHALAGAQYLTGVEVALSEQTPAAMGRLKAIADTGAMALQQVVLNHAHAQRRI